MHENFGLFRAAREDQATQRESFAETQRRGIARAIDLGASSIHQVAVTAFRAPIFDGCGHMVLALPLTTLATRLAAEWDDPVPRARAETAARLSRRLGWLLQDAGHSLHAVLCRSGHSKHTRTHRRHPLSSTA